MSSGENEPALAAPDLPSADAAAAISDRYLLPNLLLFVSQLRRAGVRVTLGQTLELVQGLEHIEWSRREQVYHAARALLVTRREDLRLFEALFARFWSTAWNRPVARPRPAPPAPRHDAAHERPFTVVSYMAYKARRFDREVDVADRAGTFSDQEALQRKDFSELTSEELRAVRRLIRDLRWRVAERHTRRRERHRRGEETDLRRTLRLAARTGGIPLQLARSRRRIKPRPLVLLADISGSMEKLSRLVLQLFFGAHRALGTEVETFLFGTRLTRITPQLRLRNVDRAIDAAARAVPDWSGGTRIGESLLAFRRRWGRRVLRRGAVVVVLSDGWERGDNELLGRETRRLQRRCHRLIWLNPLAGREGYRPLVGGMAAALPHVDDFLPVHNLQSLEQLADHLASLPSRRRGPGSRSPRALLHPVRERTTQSSHRQRNDP